MNRSLTNVLFGGISAPTATETKIEGTITKTTVDETVEYLANADSVILVCRHYVDLCFPFLSLHAGGWIWNGRCQSSVCYFRNYCFITVEGNQRPGMFCDSKHLLSIYY